ncbi:Uncharacterised protein [Porphyromonas macacae]|uniref:Uncharacterized protein n=2 Tax=Porphyromonas macacae TaxID=28115 RepID=A0A379DJW0_9PORP|nr:Uncharacterised protein [Porphyromonas macacae]
MLSQLIVMKGKLIMNEDFMDDKTITPEESLKVIQMMMQKTHNKIMKHSGIPSLIWGYTTLGTSLLVYFLFPSLGYKANFFWLLIPVLGCLLTIIMNRWITRREKLPHTQVDRLLSIVWNVTGINTFLISLCPPFQKVILSLVLIFIGMGILITGFVSSVKVLKIGSLLGMFVGYLFLFVQMSYPLSVLLFGFAFFLMCCVPGHYLVYKAKKK